MNVLTLLLLLLPLSAMASNKVATVKLLRGEVSVLKEGKLQKLKMEDWVEEGAVIKTSDKSFVKLIFVDKSSMNVGPNSEMKIEQFNGKEAGVIDVVKGQIRSQVTKDYLQIQDPNKSKLFMKTNNAVMGVRGTDFMITTNGKNTATVLFEGEVAFNSLPDRGGKMNAAKLDDIVDRGVKILPGEFSVVERDRPQPTVPSVMNLKQRETLEKNVNFDPPKPAAAAPEVTKSVVPDGLSGDSVSNSSEVLKSEVAATAAVEPKAAPTAAAGDAAGFIDGDKVKPANGSFVHLESGSIIPPPAGSVLDPDTNTYIPAPGNGSVGENGEYVPPQNVVINGDGEMFIVASATPEAAPEAKAEEGAAAEGGDVASSEASSETSAEGTAEAASTETASADRAPAEAPAEPAPAEPKLIPIAKPSVVFSPVAAPIAPTISGPVIAPTTTTTTTATNTGSTYVSPAQTTYTTTAPTETVIQNTATSGRLNVDVIK